MAGADRTRRDGRGRARARSADRPRRRDQAHARRRPTGDGSRGSCARRGSRRGSTTPRSCRCTSSATTTRAAVLHDEAARRHDARRRGSPTPADGQPLLRAFVDVCLAIELAHTRDVVHRDLKPANIMLGDYGEVYVLDWGVARVRRRRPTCTALLARRSPALDATATGSLLGTPGYMAPEQMRGARSTAAPTSTRSARSCSRSSRASRCIRAAATVRDARSRGRRRPRARAPRARDRAPELDALCRRASRRDPTSGRRRARSPTRVERYLDGDRDFARRRALAAEQLARARAPRSPKARCARDGDARGGARARARSRDARSSRARERADARAAAEGARRAAERRSSRRRQAGVTPRADRGGGVRARTSRRCRSRSRVV